jgi:hypothetical protein
MIGRSIYVADNPAFIGGSPQAVHAQLWAEGRRRRLQVRGGLAAAGLVLGTWLVAAWFGLLAAALIAAADAVYRWREHAASSVWRKGQRGERRTGRLLDFTLVRGGFRVVHGRSLPGKVGLDHLVIGPTGVVVVDNTAWPPDTDIAVYSGQLFIDGKPDTKIVSSLRASADAAAACLSEKLGGDIAVSAAAVVHGGKLARGMVTADGVTLLRPHRLSGWLRRRAVLFSPEEVGAIAEAAGTLAISKYASVVR